MRKMSALKKIALLCLALVVTYSCKLDDGDIIIIEDPTEDPLNIVETTLATEDLSNLVAALQAADGDLVSVLNGDGPFTVLAPTNAAFETFLADNNFGSLANVPTDVLSQVLLNHVITGEVISTDLVSSGAGYANTNARVAGGNAMSIYFNTTNGVTFNGISSVTSADVVGTNGVIHAIDAVIGLPTVVDFALADPTFETLVTTLTRSDLTFDYVTTLSTDAVKSPAPFTVFAPTNTALKTY